MEDPAASLPLKKIKNADSEESVSRFSERSLHSQYEIREASCKEGLLRVPYGTLFGAILCLFGLLFVILGGFRLMSLEEMMYKDVLKRDPDPQLAHKIFSIVVCTMTASLAIMALIVGFLATGATRSEVHKTWKAKLGGKIFCLVLLILSFALFILWLAACFYSGWGLNLHRVDRDNCDAISNSNDKSKCLSIPLETEKKQRELCDVQDIKKFCKDFTEKALNSIALFGCGSFLAATSMVVFICCLTANYTMIRLESKLQDLEELGPRRF